ncbi:MAG: hypothetical protein GC137_01270 [Alphaproteobacteria bacterium]|nr:hypothetical protein [Alphaproteobacteria bacterium]
MRKMILRYVVVCLMVIVSGGMLMQVSQQVQQKEREIKYHDHKIAREQENIRVLKAEWAYLNNPSRLERFVSNGMDLSPAGSESLLSDVNSMPDLHIEPQSPFPSYPGIRQDVVFEPEKPLDSPSYNSSIFTNTPMRESEVE